MAAISNGRSKTLSRWHLILGVLHLLNFAILVAVSSHKNIIDTNIETYATASVNDTEYAQNELVLKKTGRHVYPIVLVLVVFIVTAVFHFIYSFDAREIDGTGGKTVFNYAKQLTDGVVWARWVEYGITASLMNVVFTVYAGVPLESTIVCVVVLIISLMAFGAWSEMEEKRPAALKVYFLGLTAWVATLVVTFAGLSRVNPPDWVFALIVIVQLVFFGAIVAVRFVSILSKESRARYKSEYSYIILSFISKIIFAWIIVGGV